MKLIILIITMASLTAVFVACNRKSNDTTTPNAGTVVFEGSGVSLVPGDDWKQIGKGSFAGAAPAGVCLPTLVGKAGLIQVLLLPPDRSDPQIMAAGLRAAFDVNPKAIKDSFRQESVTVQSGAQVIYVAYGQQSNKEGGSESGSYNYILKNREGRGVAVNFVSTSRGDSNAVLQMIQQTLKLQ